MSKPKRLAQHVYDALHYRGKNWDKDEIIRTLDEIGLRPNIIMLEDGIETIEDADLAESLAIMEYGKQYSLTNVKTGGYDFHPVMQEM